MSTSRGAIALAQKIYKITHFHAVFHQSYLFIKVVIHICCFNPSFFSLTEVNIQSKYLLNARIPLKILNKWSFPDPAVQYVLTKMALFMPSLPSLNEIQDGCRYSVTLVAFLITHFKS